MYFICSEHISMFLNAAISRAYCILFLMLESKTKKVSRQLDKLFVSTVTIHANPSYPYTRVMPQLHKLSSFNAFCISNTAKLLPYTLIRIS